MGLSFLQPLPGLFSGPGATELLGLPREMLLRSRTGTLP